MTDAPERLERREERLAIDRVPELKGNVRIQRRDTEVPVDVDVDVRRDEVAFERRSADRPLGPDEDVLSTHDGDTVLLVTEERLEVRKVPWVVEEIHIARRQVAEQQRVTDTVRRETFDIGTDGDVELNSARNED